MQLDPLSTTRTVLSDGSIITVDNPECTFAPEIDVELALRVKQETPRLIERLLEQRSALKVRYEIDLAAIQAQLKALGHVVSRPRKPKVSDALAAIQAPEAGNGGKRKGGK